MPLSDRLLARLTMSMPDVGVRLSGRLQARLYGLSGAGSVPASGQRRSSCSRPPGGVRASLAGHRCYTPEMVTASWSSDRTLVASVIRLGRSISWLAPKPRCRSAANESEFVRPRSRAASARLWDLMSEHYGGFEMYSSKTAREIKVFALAPM